MMFLNEYTYIRTCLEIQVCDQRNISPLVAAFKNGHQKVRADAERVDAESKFLLILLIFQLH